jgi:hypothetical protein
MSILTDSGRTALAALLAAEPLHFAWGRGDATWDAPLPTDPTALAAEVLRRRESKSATALIAEIGRRTITNLNFVTPDANGAIALPTGNYSISVPPTRYLYVNVLFDFADASAETIREFAVFVGTTVNAALPPGQRYFTPDQLTSQGRLVTLERVSAVVRSPAVRENFQHVITL